MLRNKDIFSQIFLVFFVRSGISGTTLVYIFKRSNSGEPYLYLLLEFYINLNNAKMDFVEKPLLLLLLLRRDIH